jgi:uncharacterized protein YceK
MTYNPAMRTNIALLLTALAVSASGCGTVRNLADDHPRLYGGVRHDVEFLETPGIYSGREGTIVLMALWAADVCASAVADTLSIPVLYFLNQPTIERRERLVNEAADSSPGAQYSCGASAAVPAPDTTGHNTPGIGLPSYSTGTGRP